MMRNNTKFMRLLNKLLLFWTSFLCRATWFVISHFHILHCLIGRERIKKYKSFALGRSALLLQQMPSICSLLMSCNVYPSKLIICWQMWACRLALFFHTKCWVPPPPKIILWHQTIIKQGQHIYSSSWGGVLEPFLCLQISSSTWRIQVSKMSGLNLKCNNNWMQSHLSSTLLFPSYQL